MKLVNIFIYLFIITGMVLKIIRKIARQSDLREHLLKVFLFEKKTVLLQYLQYLRFFRFDILNCS